MSTLVASLTGCPPPVPGGGPDAGMCGTPLANIQSVALTPNGSPVNLTPGGDQAQLTARVVTSGDQPSTTFCVALLAGDLPTNRATDHQLGGTALFAIDTNIYEGYFEAHCTSDRVLEVFAVDQNGNWGWQSIGTAENNVYALTLPADLFSPASNTTDLKCQ